MVCYNCIGSERSQFSLNFSYFAQRPGLTTKSFLGLPVEKHGAFEDERGISTLPNLCASRKWFSPCRVGIYHFLRDNKEQKSDIKYYIQLFVS